MLKVYNFNSTMFALIINNNAVKTRGIHFSI